MSKKIARVESAEDGAMGTRAGAFDANAFFSALDAVRIARKLNWKQVAQRAGISASTLTRMSQGKRPDVDSLAALASWSGLTVDDFVITGGTVKKASPMATITAHLRSDSNLAPESAAALVDIMKAAYERLRKK